MARMINADELARVLEERKYVKKPDTPGSRIGEFTSMLGVPVIDAEPVRHGHWNRVIRRIYNSDWTMELYTCSECGNPYAITKPDFNYCARCGAKMDE